MRRFASHFGLVVLVAFSHPAHADQASNEKGCILEAAAQLPRIAGLQIVASRSVPLPAEFKPEPGMFRTIVEIDAKAAGQDETYRFVCATAPGKPFFVTRFSAR